MGKIIITRRYVGWVEDRHLALTLEDYELRHKRREEKNGYFAAILPWHEKFLQRLKPCPHCLEKPHINAMWREKDGYDYKIICPNDCGLINCGDWYHQLSRAGLDWNYRAREAAGAPHKCCPHWQPSERQINRRPQYDKK